MRKFDQNVKFGSSNFWFRAPRSWLSISTDQVKMKKKPKQNTLSANTKIRTCKVLYMLLFILINMCKYYLVGSLWSLLDKCTLALMCVGLYLGECWFLKLFSKLGLCLLEFVAQSGVLTLVVFIWTLNFCHKPRSGDSTRPTIHVFMCLLV